MFIKFFYKNLNTTPCFRRNVAGLRFGVALILTIASFFTGCRRDTEIPVDVPYVEKLVVGCVLQPDYAVEISVTKTLPLTGEFNPYITINNNGTYTESDAAVKDAEVYIINGEYNYKFDHVFNGIYRRPNFNVFPGERYELYVRWKDKTASAYTIIPIPLSEGTGKLIYQKTDQGYQYFAQCIIDPIPGVVTGISWSVDDTYNIIFQEDTLISGLKREIDLNGDGKIEMHSRPIPADVANLSRYFLNAKVYAFDAQFYNFYRTQNGNLASNDIFAHFGSGQYGNIKGDGIGLFIGMSTWKVHLQ